MRQILRVIVALLRRGGSDRRRDGGLRRPRPRRLERQRERRASTAASTRPATTTAARTPATTTPVTMPATIAARSHSQATTAASTTAPARPPTIARPTSTRWPSPQHGNPEGVAFDKRSGFFFVSATGDGSIYRGRLGDTATPVPVFIPGAAGQSATGLKVAARQALRGRREHGDDQGLRRRQRRAAGDVRHQGRRQLADLRQRPRRHQARRRLRDRLQAPRDLPPDGRGDRRRHAGAQADRPRRRHLDVARDPVQRRAGGVQPQRHRRRRRPRGRRGPPPRRPSSPPRRPARRQAHRRRLGHRAAVPGQGRQGRQRRAQDPRARRSTAARSRAATDCSSTAAGCSSCRARTRTTASPTGSSTSSTLRHGGRDGRLADQRTDASFQGPSTIARARDRYLVVNPDFATSTPPFTVTALPR